MVPQAAQDGLLSQPVFPTGMQGWVLVQIPHQREAS